MQESGAERADNATHELNRQICSSQHVEIYHIDQECEASRREQAWLQAELEIREKAHRDARTPSCLGIAFLSAGTSISLTFVVLTETDC